MPCKTLVVGPRCSEEAAHEVRRPPGTRAAIARAPRTIPSPPHATSLEAARDRASRWRRSFVLVFHVARFSGMAPARSMLLPSSTREFLGEVSPVRAKPQRLKLSVGPRAQAVMPGAVRRIPSS